MKTFNYHLNGICKSMVFLAVIGFFNTSLNAQDSNLKILRPNNSNSTPSTNVTPKVKGAPEKSSESQLKKMFHDKRTSEYVVTSEHTSSVSGLHHVYINQAINGVEIMGTESSLHFDTQGKLFKTNSAFVNNIEQFVKNSVVSLTAEQAITMVSQNMNYGTPVNLIPDAEENRNSLKKTDYAQRLTYYTDGGVSSVPIPVKQIYFYNKDSGVVLSWELTIMDKNSSDWYTFIVNASTGEIVHKFNLTHTCNANGNHADHDHSNTTHNENEAFNFFLNTNESSSQVNEDATAPFVGGGFYRVYPLPVESPYYGGRTLVSDPADADASPNGWQEYDGTYYVETAGNNVLCYDDSANDNTLNYPADFSTGTGTGANVTFDFPLDLNYSAANPSRDASITNSFYWTNVIHDVVHHYGFDEAAGNFQQTNYSGQGNGADPVLSEIQDGNGTCNANFGTPPDGQSGRKQTYTCGAQDGVYDNVVTVHEYTHGISNRLTGGAAAAACLQNAEQMGEGWGDYLGLVMTMEPGDQGTDQRTIGTFLYGQGANGAGIRPQPYSTTNTQTYADVASISGGAVHHIGSIWSAILWKLNWAFIDVYGWDSDIYYGTGGNNKCLELVMEGMKLQGCNPGFVTGRDGILAADQAINGGVNADIIWQVFADAGLGVNADEGSTNSYTDGTTDNTVPPPSNPTISYAYSTATQAEGSDCTHTDVNIPLSIGVGASQNATATFNVSGGTATNGTDFALVNNSVTFSQGATAPQNLVIRVYNDSFIEGEETITVDFTVNANGGDAGTGNNSFTLTINDDDFEPLVSGIVPVFSDDFENGFGQWTISTAAATNDFAIGNNATANSQYFASDNSNTTNFAFVNDDAVGDGYDMSEERIQTAPMTLAAGETHAFSFDYVLGTNYGGTASVELAVIDENTGQPGAWIDFGALTGVAEDTNIPFSLYENGATNGGAAPVDYIFSIVYRDAGQWAQGLIIDNVVISGNGPLPVQTAVNSATTNSLALETAGSAYAYDLTSGNLMLNYNNTNGYNYGCVDASVTRSGNNAQAYNGSASPAFVTDKSFTIAPTNTTTNTATEVTFYFTEAEIAGWEAVTGLSRNNMFAKREGSNDISPLTVSNYDTNVALTGTFTGLDGDYFFGPETAFRTTLSAKVFLQGAAMNPNTGEETLMRDDLRVAGLIPTTSPYADALTTTAAVLNATGNNAIVDWVSVELRDATDSSVIITSQSALLQRDGDVVGLDGVSAVKIGVPSRAYYVAINHRNHMPIMSANALSLTDGVGLTDFTTTITTSGNNAQTTDGMPTGVSAMWAGNVNGDNQIRYQGSGNDTNSIKDIVVNEAGNSSGSNLYQFTGYNAADINLDGTIRYQGSGNDSNTIKDIILNHPENGSGSNLFSFSKQY